MKKELTINDMELVNGGDLFVGLTKEQWREVFEQLSREEKEKSSK